MVGQKPKSITQPGHKREGITRIRVGGFKSINQEQSIEIRPLTILAGANSSGKSSIMQPLLLLKQTLEASYDPGALLLSGPNVRFTLANQLLSRTSGKQGKKTFHVGIEARAEAALTTYFIQSKNKGFDVEQTIYDLDNKKYRIYWDMSQEDIQAVLSTAFRHNPKFIPEIVETKTEVVPIQNRCFLSLATRFGPNYFFDSDLEHGLIELPNTLPGEMIVGNYVRRLIHLPGLRGNPERNYRVAAVGSEFIGTFENYAASVIWQWQLGGDKDKLEKLNFDLSRLGLTKKVVANPIDATQIELLVNRFPHGVISDTDDMVSIADVGFGVSQALPVVVALHAADEGQLIYLEQPEIHLHPRAQTALAEVLADAAMQGKRMVVETHSSLLLLGIQTLVAEGKLPPELVKLHWFTQQEDGSTKITSADLDETGAYGDWPEDFDTVTLNSESRYLDAAQARLRGNGYLGTKEKIATTKVKI